MTQTTLKPCPFCGFEARIGRNFGRVSADCGSCGVSVRSNVIANDETATKEVTEIWNSRVRP